MSSPDAQELARLTLRADMRWFPAADRFVREMAQIAGLDATAIDRLGLVVEEAVLNAVQHAFLPGEPGRVELAVSRPPGRLVVAVEDQGLPFDPARVREGPESGIGMKLIRGFADEVRFVNRGRHGKRLELIKYLPSADVAAYLSPEECDAPPIGEGIPAAPLDTPLTLRPLRPDETVELSRLVYRVYGYSYAGDFIYFPERIRERLEAGLTLACAAVTDEGELAGHVALNLEAPGATIGEVAQAVVDPRFRGRKLFERMQRELLGWAGQRGMVGAYSEAVTVHPFTQKGNLALGARELGFMFGYSPQKTRFKGINEQQAQRQTALLMYRTINPPPRRCHYPPLHHRSVLGRIVEHNALPRDIRDTPAGPLPRLPAHTGLEVHSRPEWGHALMRVLHYGDDFIPLLRARLREQCLDHIDTLFLDLPLSEPHTARLTAEAEALGFFFCGLVPELSERGDVLRLQYLNNVAIDPGRLQVASEFGRELLAYVASQMAQGLELT